MPKVTMALSVTDARNAAQIQESTEARSKAHALSIALSLTRFVIDQIVEGKELLIRNQDGKLERVFMPELENLKRDGESLHHTMG